MIYDFHAKYDLLNLSPTAQEEAIDYLCYVTKQPPHSSTMLKDIHDDGAKLQVLAQALNTENKERARTGVIKGKSGGLLHWMKSGRAEEHFVKNKKKMVSLDIWSASPKVECLPKYSSFLHFKFMLTSPYISRDDEIFHINDNPVRKDKVFKVPMVAATGWKGVLRAALWQLGHKEDNEVIIRLFGNPRKCEDGQAGRLYFYPTFFDKIGMEVINPHNRETGAGARGPILMECVPAETSGTFTLLYVPFDRIGKEEQETRKQVASDLELLIKGIQAMFATYGFGAKTSSGFGTAEIANEGGSIVLKFPDAKESKPKPTEPQEPESIQQFKQEFPNEDYSLKPKEWAKKHSSSKKDQYIKVKEEFRKYRDELNSYPSRLKEWEELEQAPASPVTKKTFTDCEGLNGVVNEIIGVLKNGAPA